MPTHVLRPWSAGRTAGRRHAPDLSEPHRWAVAGPTARFELIIWHFPSPAGRKSFRAVHHGHRKGTALSNDGTSVCSTGVLTLRLGAANRGALLAHRDLAAIVAEHRRHAHRIVCINGCFDVLRRGHVAYLRQARATS